MQLDITSSVIPSCPRWADRACYVSNLLVSTRALFVVDSQDKSCTTDLQLLYSKSSLLTSLGSLSESCVQGPERLCELNVEALRIYLLNRQNDLETL